MWINERSRGDGVTEFSCKGAFSTINHLLSTDEVVFE